MYIFALILNDEIINFSPLSIVLDQDSLREAIVSTIISRGFSVDTVTFDTDGYLLTMSVTKTNSLSIALLFDQCQPLVMIKENCCDVPLTESKYGNTVLTKDLFQQTISYDGLNISQIDYFNGCSVGKITNEYVYDKAFRLITAENSIVSPTLGTIQDLYDSHYTYDEVGNLLSLTRNSVNDISSGSYKQIDNLVYNYTAGELKNVIDNSGEELGFPVSTATQTEISYDGNGNMLSFPSKGIQQINYNVINLPTSIIAGETVYFDISFSGAQVKKVGTGGETRDYLGSIEFLDGAAQFYGHVEGRVVFTEQEKKYQYTLKDHLGNTMLLFEDSNLDGILENDTSNNQGQDAEILQRNYYYAFGLSYDGLNPDHCLPENNYKYNGKELHKDGGLGLYNYGARFYDPAIGRFTTVDPLASDFADWNPYHYVHNNPILLIDPTGMSADTAWTPIREWNNEDFDKYQRSVETQIIEMTECGEESDCADLAIKLLIGYASEEGLEVEFTLANGTRVNSTTDSSTSPGEFESKVTDSANAESIQNDMVSIPEPEASDMTNNGFHVNMVTKPVEGTSYSESVYPGASSTLGGTTPRRHGVNKDRADNDGFKRWRVIDGVKPRGN